MSWKKGPLPPDTWNWGGVVPVSLRGTGFLFADFLGDRIKTTDGKEILANDVAWYDNGLTMPPPDTTERSN